MDEQGDDRKRAVEDIPTLTDRVVPANGLGPAGKSRSLGMPRPPPWVAVLACSLLVVSFLFPPFVDVSRPLPRYGPSFEGFEFIFDYHGESALDFRTLLMEWLGIVLLAVGLSYVRVKRD